MLAPCNVARLWHGRGPAGHLAAEWRLSQWELLRRGAAQLFETSHICCGAPKGYQARHDQQETREPGGREAGDDKPKAKEDSHGSHQMPTGEV
jgi:hypothetical protein